MHRMERHVTLKEMADMVIERQRAPEIRRMGFNEYGIFNEAAVLVSGFFTQSQAEEYVALHFGHLVDDIVEA